MAMRTRGDYYKMDTQILSQKLVPASRLVAGITGLHVQRNKAIVGRNAFAHEAGIHQDGMLKEASTYEIMRPQDVGFLNTDLVLGKHSGRAALADRAKKLGYSLEDERLNRVFADFKILADKKKEIYDSDIAALIEQQIRVGSPGWTIESYRMQTQTGQTPRVLLTLRHGEQVETKEMICGDGPVDAIFLAIEELTGYEVRCVEFSVHSVSVGRDAQGEVNVEVEYQGQRFRGRGISTDSVEASAIAFLEAINRIVTLHDATKAK